MLRIGLSGGIGSGKSTVAGRLADLGAVVIDADVLAREVVAPGTPGLAEITEQFGADVLDETGGLDRPAMAQRIFGDDEARRRLNGIVHPRVVQRTGELMAQAPNDAIVVHDVPLLVEAGYAPNYHLVIIVDAPLDDRLRRLEQRGVAEADARARIDAQATEAQRREVADVWLNNGDSVAALHAEIDQLWQQRLAPYEVNLRRELAPNHSAPLVEHDPAWAVQARRLAVRLDVAAGRRVGSVEHIGLTAVPEIPAEDVLELQVGVPSAADVEAVAAPLAAAGFPAVQRNPENAEGPEPEVTEGAHGSADPGRPATVRVRVAGSPGWRRALLLRDWLTAHPDSRAQLAELVRAGEDRATWFTRAVERAEQWADSTGWHPEG